MAKWYKKYDGKVKLYVSISSREDRIQRSRIISMPTGRERERIKKIEEALENFEIEVNRNFEINQISFEKFCYMWLEDCKISITQKTYDDYKYRIKKVMPFLKNKNINSITAHQIQLMYDELLKNLSARTVKGIHIVLKIIFSSALKKYKAIDENIMEFVNPPRVEKKETESIPLDVIPILISKIEAEPIKKQCIFLLALLGGLRRGEIAGLNREDLFISKNIDESSYLIIKHSYLYSQDGNIYKSPKTNKFRTVSLPEYLEEKLREYIKTVYPLYPKNKNSLHANALFKQADGERLYPTTPTQMWIKFLKKHPDLPIQDVTFHGLRHTSGSILISAGMDIETVSKRLGHSNTTTTLNVYSHIVQNKAEEINDIFNNVILK